MLPSDITKMAQSFSDIAEGKNKDDSYLETDMKKRQKNNEKARKDMEKVKDDTVPRWMREKFELVVEESYYYKRLKVMNVELAERFLDIAEGCIVMGYESPRLIDNIAEALDKDIVGHDFRAALGTVNPHLNENAQSAGRKQARAVAIQISEAPQKQGVYGKVGGLEIGTNPGRNQDLGYRAGRALTNMSGDLVKGVGQSVANMFQGKLDTPENNPAAYRQQQRLNNIGNFFKTGQLPSSGNPQSSPAPAASTPAPAASTPAPSRPRTGQGGRPLGSTAQRQGGAVNPSNAAPAKPAPAPAAPAKPAPTAATKPAAPAKTYNVGGTQMSKAAINKKYDSLRSDPAAAKKFGMSANTAIYGKNFAKPKTPNPLMNGYEHVHSKLIEGVRDLDPEKGTEERKKRLERKRGMKLDDHPEYKKEEVSLYDIVVGYLLDEKLAIDEDHAVLVLPELSAEEVAYIVDEYTTKHGKKAMDWNRSDDKPKTVAKNSKMPKKKEGKCSCCGDDPCTC